MKELFGKYFPEIHLYGKMVVAGNNNLVRKRRSARSRYERGLSKYWSLKKIYWR